MRFGPTTFGRDPFGTARESFAVEAAVEALLRDATLERIYLVELFPYDPSEGRPVSRTFAQGRTDAPIYTRRELGQNVRKHYPKVVHSAVNSEVAIFGNRSGLSGGGGTSFGAIALQFASDDLDELTKLRWDGRRAQVLLGAPGFSYEQFRTVFQGRIGQATWDLERFQVSVESPEAELQRPIQEVLYSGVEGFTSIEGGSDLRNRPKPLSFGAPRNVSPVLVNRSRLVYQYHDRASDGVDSVYDRGVALTTAPDPAGGAKETGEPAGDVARLFGTSATVFAWRAHEGPVAAVAASQEFTSDTGAGGPSFEGYVAGQDVETAGFGEQANNGVHTIQSLDTSGSVHRMVVGTVLVDEAADPAQTIASDPAMVSGQYVSERARGLLRLGGSPAGTVTADVRGDSGSDLGFVQTPAEIVRRIATMAKERGSLEFTLDIFDGSFHVGVSKSDPLTGGTFFERHLDLGSFDDLDLSHPYPVSVYTGGEAPSIASVLDSILTPMLLYRNFSRTGLLRVGSAAFDTPADVIEEPDVISIERIVTDVPPWRISIGYARAWTVQGPDELAAAATDAHKDFVGSERRAVVDEDSAIREAHENSEPVEQPTALDAEGNATSEAARQRSLVGVDRDSYQAEVARRSLLLLPGQTVTLRHPRFGLSAGRDMLLLRVAEDTSAETTTLVLWG